MSLIVLFVIIFANYQMIKNLNNLIDFLSEVIILQGRFNN